jgi:hypothetical protein
MAEAHEKAEEERRWETAYWVSGLMTAAQMAGRTKKVKVIQPKNLMKPFIKKKTKAEKFEEGERFFERFYKQRKEDENHGGSSGLNCPN